MKNLLKYIPILSVIIGYGCADMQPDVPDGESSLTMVLNISDMAAESRASSSDTEPINTLRVIVARPDGQVEYNRLLRPLGNSLTDEDLRFRICHDTHKTVVLIANEDATGKSFDNISGFDPMALSAPDAHPTDLMNVMVSALPTSKTSVPMTAIYQLGTSLDYAVKIGADKYEIRYSISLMRALTKFTFNIINNRQIPVNITGIGISHAKASAYRLFPQVVTQSGTRAIHYINAEGTQVTESGTGMQPIVDNGLPGTSPFSEHFRTNYVAAQVATDWHSFTDETTIIPADADMHSLEYYYYESNLPDDADVLMPYTLYVDFDNNRYTTPLENLPSLPRNTHVVVNMQFNNNDKTLDIEVLPYYGVSLNPGFGKPK